MPTYQYACTACDERLEVVQKFSDDPLTECPACHGRLRKVFSPVGVVFKGSGFYKTDSRSASSGGTSKSDPAAKGDTAKPAESSASSSGSGSAAGSSESKTAKKATTTSGDSKVA